MQCSISGEKRRARITVAIAISSRFVIPYRQAVCEESLAYLPKAPKEKSSAFDSKTRSPIGRVF